MRIALACALGAGLFGAGCDDDVTKKDAAVPPDMSVPQDMAGCATTTPSGTLVLTSLSGPMGNILSPVVTFNTQAVKIGGCTANHYDSAAGTNPPTDVDDGTVVITKYAGGMLASGGAAPSEIDCVLGSDQHYHCGFGPLVGGKLGPAPDVTPFAQGVMPLAPGSTVQFKSPGGACAGSFDTADEVQAAGAVKVTEDLNALKYDAAQDTVIHFDCGGGCGVLAINVLASQNAPDKITDPSPTSGQLTCTFLNPGGSSVTIPKADIAKMLGGDAKLKTIRTVVLRTNVPNLSRQDSKGNGLTVGAGLGVVGFSTR